MAKIVSPVWSTARGSIAGTTYLSNQFAAIVGRQRVVPTNPNSNAQTRIRAAFSSAIIAWNAMSDADRELWNSYAATLTYAGIQGPIAMPGRQVFISNYAKALYLYNRGVLTSIPGTDPPTAAGFLGLININYLPPTSGNTGFQISCGNSSGESVKLIAQRSFKQNACRNFFKGPWVASTLTSVTVAESTSGSLSFNSLETGGIYFAQISACSAAAPFRLFPPVILRCVAVETEEADLRVSSPAPKKLSKAA